MPEFDFLREISLSDAEIKTLPELLEFLSINEEIRNASPLPQTDRFRRASCFPGAPQLEELRERFRAEIEQAGEYAFLENEQAVLSQALVLGISVDRAGDDLELTADELKALLRKIHSRSRPGSERN